MTSIPPPLQIRNPFPFRSPTVAADEQRPFSRLGGLPIGGTGTVFDRLLAGALFQANIAQQQRQLQTNPFVDQLADPFREGLATVRSQRGALSGLQGDLTRSAIGRTSGAQTAAVQAARAAGGGRGGLAFSGGAGARASRAAQQAASGQSASLADALTRARLSEAQFERGLTQQEIGLQAGLSTALGQQAGFRQQRNQFDTQLGLNIANLLSGLAAPGSQIGIGFKQAASQQKSSTIQALGDFFSSGNMSLGGE